MEFKYDNGFIRWLPAAKIYSATRLCGYSSNFNTIKQALEFLTINNQ